MKRVICTICLIAISLITGCAGSAKAIHAGYTHSTPFIPHLMIPGLYLVIKNIEELNAMMEAEEKAMAEDAQRKNPAWFMKVEKRRKE